MIEHHVAFRLVAIPEHDRHAFRVPKLNGSIYNFLAGVHTDHLQTATAESQ